MSTQTTNQQGSKVKRYAIAGLSGAALIAYWLLFGMGGAKDFTDKDLRSCDVTNSDDCSSDVERFRAQDLIEATFLRANISGLDMTGTQLRETNMESVVAEGTNFSQAFFNRANLQNANLQNADLTEATFEYADLRNADLRGADLRGVDFRHTNLEGADLRDSLGGPSCPERRFGAAKEHCGLSAEDTNSGCCPPAFGSTSVEGMKACLQPWWDIIRQGQTQDFGVQGEPEYEDVDRIDNGRYICTE